MRDAQWIATLLRAGLLKGSFIPDKTFRELRHLTRYRKSIVCDITAQKNRIDKFLQSSGFRFTAFLSDAFGASGETSSVISWNTENIRGKLWTGA